jgi:hypothetical protein
MAETGRRLIHYRCLNSSYSLVFNRGQWHNSNSFSDYFWSELFWPVSRAG